MKRHLGMLALSAMLLSGCVSLTSRSAHDRMAVQDALPHAFTKARNAAIAMGGSITVSDPVSGSLAARLNKAVMLNVTMTPEASGTVLGIHATADGGYVLEHDVPDDVEAFKVAYRRQ